MSIPWSAVAWQSTAAILAAVLALVAGLGAIKAKGEQNAQAQNIEGWLTGGDSYPYLEPFVFPQGITYLIKHAGGKYPLYDVQVRLQDLDYGPRLEDGSLLPTKSFRAGTLTGNTDKFPVGIDDLKRENPPSGSTEVRRFRIELPSRNGLVLQEVTMTAVEGRWHTNSHPIQKEIKGKWVDLEPANFQEAQNQKPRVTTRTGSHR